MQEAPQLLTEIRNRVLYITMNRPEKRNALNFSMVTDLRETIRVAEVDQQVKVIVIRSSGKAFCAGADLDYLQRLQNYSFEENHKDSIYLMELFHQIYRCPKMVIAQVEGPALAGGCGLATVADFTFATPESKFGYTEVRIGFIPAIVSALLLRKIGETKAKEMLLSGKIYNAEEVARFNLINDLIPAERMGTFITEFAETLCVQNSGTSMEITKKMIADLPDLPLPEALKFAARMNAHARGSDDCRKGISAFLNKETPAW